MALKRPMLEHLRSRSADHFSRGEYLDLFKCFLRCMVRDAPLADWCGLVSCIVGVWTVVLGLDVGNVTGIRDILDAVEGFAEFWRSAVRENEREVREEVWRKMELERATAVSQNGPVGSAGRNLMAEVPAAEAAAATADLQLTYTNILTMGLDSLAGQIERARASSL